MRFSLLSFFTEKDILTDLTKNEEKGKGDDSFLFSMTDSVYNIKDKK